MRFSFATLITAALVGAATAAPTKMQARATDIENIGTAVCYLEAGLGVTATSEFLDKELGGAISDLEEKLGVTDLEKALNTTSCKIKPTDSDLILVAKGICYLEKGLGITALSDSADKLLGGAISELEKTLGITQLETLLKLNTC
ncbi:hypothetical protein IE53DRAFT_382946 [Violaceomyces palustris]|uniref:Uncharacterized protein n=1 Tax=Violaceomyces palustris TaxID=1673888 RepID=A0ACD0P8S4_9BASI|nr:hypothetical protein IE53DRAFT_382946 [Violaceomyces palustris]